MTKDDATSIARAEAEREGWPWIEPVLVSAEHHAGARVWRFMTNARYMGGNVNILIDDETGVVVSKGFARR